MMEFKSAMLPINLKDGLYLDASTALDFGEALVVRILFRRTFPHIVIDNFLPTEFIEKLLQNFLVEKKDNDKVYEKGYGGLHKRQIFPNDCNQYIRDAFNFFNSSSI